MAKIKQQFVGQSEIRRPASPLSVSPQTSTFGEQVYTYRMQLGRRQRAIAIAAGISESYLSEIENCKRIAPPRATALRIAQALNLSGFEANRFAGVAEAERASLHHDLHLPPKIREIVALIRVAGPLLPAELLDLMHAKLQEACM